MTPRQPTLNSRIPTWARGMRQGGDTDRYGRKTNGAEQVPSNPSNLCKCVAYGREILLHVGFRFRAVANPVCLALQLSVSSLLWLNNEPWTRDVLNMQRIGRWKQHELLTQ